MLKEIAIQFGTSLDQDDFETTKKLLSSDCQYRIGDTTLSGPEAICQSYEQNMLEGRKKLDTLEWGQSQVEPIDASTFYVHFTDYLTHKGISYTHRCKQKLTIGKAGKIVLIEHVTNAEEQARLKAYYQKVGIGVN